MKFQSSLLAIALIGSLASNAALADQNRSHFRQGFSTDVTRTTAAGRSMHRHTEQVTSQNQFVRRHQLETGAGQSASRMVTGSYDSDTQSISRNVEGVRLNGDTYATNRSLAKTQDGYTKSATHTNASGATASKQAQVIFDVEAQTMTKTISATNYQGETKSATVVRSYQAGIEE